jgi:hypothetical protein
MLQISLSPPHGCLICSLQFVLKGVGFLLGQSVLHSCGIMGGLCYALVTVLEYTV